MCLEQFSGIVIFAANLVKTYDRHVQPGCAMWPLPCLTSWLTPDLGEGLLVRDIIVQALVETHNDVSGHDTKHAIFDTAVRAARQQRAFTGGQNCRGRGRSTPARNALIQARVPQRDQWRQAQAGDDQTDP